MRSKQYITLIFILFISSIAAQESTFLNEVLIKNKKDSIFLDENYLNDYGVQIKNFNEANFREWWVEMPNEETSSITTFFENFNLDHLRSKLQSNKNDSVIDFKKLNKHFIKVKVSDIKYVVDHTKDKTDLSHKKDFKNTFFSISKPIFNSSENWAIYIIKSQNLYYNIYSGGQLLIYQKLNCKWTLYHKFYLWLY